MKKYLLWVVWMVGAVVWPASARSEAPLPFVAAMRRQVAQWREEVPALRRSADAVAIKLIAGGNIYAASTQPSFQAEALGRSGGLMMLRAWNESTPLTARDTVLCALNAESEPETLKTLLQRARSARATVLISAGPSRGLLASSASTQLLPRRVFRGAVGPSPGVESVSNIVGLWSWTAALLEGCVQRGKMPSFYLSNAMPGGGERNALLRQSAFHTKTNVTAKSVARLPFRYLKALDEALSHMLSTQQPAFRRGASLLRATVAQKRRVAVAYTGHMFPDELRGTRRPAWLVAAKTQIDATIPPELNEGDTLLYLGYQAYPYELATALKKKNIASIIASSRPPLDGWLGDAGSVYIQPFWEVQDAALFLSGYDTPVLPVSGILQSTVYWQLVQLSS